MRLVHQSLPLLMRPANGLVALLISFGVYCSADYYFDSCEWHCIALMARNRGF